MSSTAHKTADEYREFFDSEEELAAKVEQLVAWLRESNSTLAFTGAGISTAAGVPDFRSGLDTTLDVGAGCWVARAAAKGELPDEVVQASAKKKRKPRKSTSTLQAIPTFTHMALVELQRAGLLSTLVSQNTDGLHRRSGFPVDAMAELHGNSNLEVCGLRTGKKNRGCGHAYMRDYRTRTARKVHDHRTGRRCTVDGCNGPLYDTIINFGEDLPERELELGFDAAERADLCIAMGSSLRVTPAADMPQRVAERGKHLVVINLQSTPLDDVADLRINGKVDDVMKLVMERLGMDVPEFRLRRLVRVKVEQKSAPSKRVPGTEIVRNTVSIDGLDTDCQTPFSLFTRVLVDMPSQAKGKSKRARFDLNAEPYAVKARAHRDDLDGDERLMHVDLQFAGHYAEPPVALSLPCEPGSTVFMLEYDPFRRVWSEPVEVE